MRAKFGSFFRYTLYNVQVVVHLAQDICEDCSENIVISLRHKGLLKVRLEELRTEGSTQTYRVVSLCSTRNASRTVVVYSIPVVRLVPAE